MIIKILGKERVLNFLKVHTNEQGPSKSLRTHEWWLHDNIEAIQHCLKETDVNGNIEQKIDFIIPANQGDFNMEPRSAGDSRESFCSYIFIVAKNKKGDEFTIATNSVVYLLNDEGKTIEKLTTHSY